MTAYDNWKLAYPKHWDNEPETCNECGTELDEGEDCPECFPTCENCIEVFPKAEMEGKICKECASLSECCGDPITENGLCPTCKELV